MAQYQDPYGFLYQRGAHFVLCYRDGTKKRPIWEQWQSRRPGPDVARGHPNGMMYRGGERLVGIIPWSIQRTVIDQDGGTPHQLTLFHPPELILPSDRNGRHHLYYPDDQPRGLFRWAALGASGEVVSDKGYVILYGAAVELLAEAVAAGNVAGASFPADLFEYAGLPEPARRPRAGGPGALSPQGAPVTGGSRAALLASYPWRDGEIELEAIYPGIRHHAIFDAVRLWAYQQRRGGDLADWIQRVKTHTTDANRRFPVPIKAYDADATAYSIATWCWGHTTAAPDHSPEAQARRGRASGAARRRRTAERDAFIRQLAAVGLSRRRIARVVEADFPDQAVSDRQISEILRGGKRTLIRGGGSRRNPADDVARLF